MAGVKGAVAWPNGKAYLFDKEIAGLPGSLPGTTYVRYDFASGTQEQAPQLIATNWSGLTIRPDAAAYWGFGKVYFFYGDAYVRYDIPSDRVDPEYLTDRYTIAGNWKLPWTDHIDAAVNWGNGKIYFFHGSEYARYDITQDRTDDNYPKAISGNWNGIWPDSIDAVLYQGGRMAYFFRGDEVRRFNLATNTVDQTQNVGTLTLDPVPAGLWTPARELSLAQANVVMGYFIQNGKLSLSPQTPYGGDWQSGITSPSPAAHVVIQPANINGVDFINDAGPAPLIDNVDQRMLVALYRVTLWMNGSEPDVSVIRHKGIGHGGGPPNDCHNQGRALDFSGVDGTSNGAAFDRKILRDWGNLPIVPGIAMRLNPSVDRLAHDLFRRAFRFGTFECECNGIGPSNKWPPKEIGDQSGFVIHPDYIDSPGGNLRTQHQDHSHMQIGPTRV